MVEINNESWQDDPQIAAMSTIYLFLRHGSGRLCNLARMHMHSDILDQVSNEEILKIFAANKPRVLDFGGSIIKAFNHFLLILRPYHLNVMPFLIRFLMVQYSCMFP